MQMTQIAEYPQMYLTPAAYNAANVAGFTGIDPITEGVRDIAWLAEYDNGRGVSELSIVMGLAGEPRPHDARPPAHIHSRNLGRYDEPDYTEMPSEGEGVIGVTVPTEAVTPDVLPSYLARGLYDSMMADRLNELRRRRQITMVRALAAVPIGTIAIMPHNPLLASGFAVGTAAFAYARTKIPHDREARYLNANGPSASRVRAFATRTIDD